MLKLITPLAIAALSVISIAPKSQAIPINLNSIFIGQQGGDTRVKAVIQLGSQSEYYPRWEAQRQSEWTQQRERPAERRHHRYYSRQDSRQDRDSDYRGAYRRDR
jgi:hypothetical protein